MWNEIIGEFNLSDFANKGIEVIDISIGDMDVKLEENLEDLVDREKKEKA